MSTYRRYVLACTLLMVHFGLAAQTPLADVEKSLARYNACYSSEKLFLHTDKNNYLAGEITWFKLYVVNSISHKPMHKSKLAYVEILDMNNLPILRTKVALSDKGGSGSLLLPLNIRSGYYTLRAYTNWMKNAGADQFFESSLTIINPFKNLDTTEQKQVPSYRLKLFPEGGNLVNGISSRVAFHLTDGAGKGLNGKGFLLYEKDTLSSFEPHKFGMGYFEVAPKSTGNYRVVFKLDNGRSVSENLPKVFDKGYTLHLQEVENEKIRVTVKANVVFDNPEIYLLAQTRQTVKAVKKNILVNGTAAFTLNKNDLGEGVSQFTIFDENRTPVCERLFFIAPEKNTLPVLLPAGQVFKTRVKVEVPIASAEQANLSVSVFKLDSLDSGEINRIEQYVWLTSELNGRIENPDYYFSPATKDVQSTTDLLMLTHGWRRFKWETVLNTKPALQFQPEFLAHIVTARVTDAVRNTPSPNVQLFLSVPNAPQKFFTTVSDSNGIAHFYISDHYGLGEMILQTFKQNGSSYKIEILSPFSEAYSSNVNRSFHLSPSLQHVLVGRSIGMQTEHVYHFDSITFKNPAIADTLPFYGKPLYSYRLDDYKRFNTMEEVLREYVRQLGVGTKAGSPTLRIFNETDRQYYFNDNILIMVDGVPLSDPDKVFALNPLRFRQIDVINKGYILGPSLFYGLANFLSYDGFYEGLELDPQTLRVDYEGMQLQREFYSPDYSTAEQKASRLPDLRTTLYWQPNLSSNRFSFYTGDNKGQYLIMLQGFAADGKPVSSHYTMEVK